MPGARDNALNSFHIGAPMEKIKWFKISSVFNCIALKLTGQQNGGDAHKCVIIHKTV